MGAMDIRIHEDDQQVLKQIQPRVKMEQSLVPDENYSDEDDDLASSDDEVDESVAEDMQRLEESFKGISEKYRLINRIGEGTFSTVYKAESLLYSSYDDTENTDPTSDGDDEEPRRAKRCKLRHDNPRAHRFVALKKIYVTSSPHRILNELELLHELRDSEYICPLLTAFRHHDQVIAVLPYFKHIDFRIHYRNFIVNDMRHYFKSLFTGLAHVHRAGILHRDIKPTNFLYDAYSKTGVLVDFGLAERQGTDWQPCVCQEHKDVRRNRFLNSTAVQNLQYTYDNVSQGYPKNDTRPTRRANRAGTRGFRAPEVLLKCTMQTTKIDIWSAGVILLTMLARRFPFFNSTDDIDAMIEIASIFGKKKMQAVSAMHGVVFETNIETIGDRGFSLEKIILWASCREKNVDGLHVGEHQAVDLLSGLLELDPTKRLSAREALRHPFFTEPIEDEVERDEREENEMLQEEDRLREIERRRKKISMLMKEPDLDTHGQR